MHNDQEKNAANYPDKAMQADTDLGRIQELLFGEHLRANESQLQALRDDIDQKIRALSKISSQELNALTQKIDQNVDTTTARFDKLDHRLDDQAKKVEDTSVALVPAIQKQLATDNQLSDTLKPVIVEKFHATTRDEPEVMADALYPILGPAIRKMVASMFTPDKNNKQVSYQLEQLFLIESESGLPLCHASSDNSVVRDVDMVSGMLSAIQSFVQDAFSTNGFDGLDTLQVGDLSVWIVWGPKAVLASVIRGAAPQKLRDAMQEELEVIHRDYATVLGNYDGDTSTFEPLQPTLQQFLTDHDGSLRSKLSQLPKAAKKWLLATALLCSLLVIWCVYTVYDRARFSSWVASIDALPGVIITDTDRSLSGYTISGLKDPIATDPHSTLPYRGIEAKHVTLNFEPYRAVHSSFALPRFKQLLGVSDGADVKLNGTTLTIKGGSDFWQRRVVQHATTIEGIATVVVQP